MTAKWNPAKGELFYLRFNPRQQLINDEFGTATMVVLHQDSSYKTDIFRMIASDESLVVAEKLTDIYNAGHKYTFATDRITMLPVSPQVANALEIIR